MLVVISWFLITQFTPYLNQVYDFKSINIWILPYIRMTLMFLVTFFYILRVEKQSFSNGFNFYFRNFWKNLLWAVVFFAATYVLITLYEKLIVNPILHKGVTASSTGVEKSVKPFGPRLFEYVYIVYEGIVEVLIFIGFLVDRLMKKWGPTVSLIIGNIIFALWHYSYWKMGFLTGSLMIFLTFIAGVVISLNYLKTRNTLSSTLCHIFVDTPSALRILLGR